MWVLDTEADGFIEEATTLHCFVTKQYKKNNWVVACDKSRLNPEFIEQIEAEYSVTWIDREDIVQQMVSSGIIVCHNLFGFDLELLKRLGYLDSYEYNKINGKHCKTIDSLSMSRCLWPDRPLPHGCPKKVYNPVTGKHNNVGPHGLQAWGYRVANMKPKVDDWRNQPLEVYVNRCIEDVVINELTLTSLIEESKKVAKRGGDWKEAIATNQYSDFEMAAQERNGVLLDREGARKLRDYIDVEMKKIADWVDPQLPERDLPKSKQPKFPENPFTGSGEISAHGWNWIRKLGYPVNEDYFNQVDIPKKPFKADESLSAHGLKFAEKMGWGLLSEPEIKQEIKQLQEKQALISPLPSDLFDQARQDLIDQRMPKLTEPMTISNQQDIKQYLVEQEGWEPTLWRTKDITRDGDKRENSKDVQLEKAELYYEEILESPYKRFVYQEMEMNFEARPKKAVIAHILKKGRYLVTSPKLKDERGELCPNLEALNGKLGKQIVKWLSLRNRRSVIQALDEKKDTGWLNNPRLDVDGRIGQGFSGVTNTNRYKHVTIVNLPKASDDVVLGKEMRGLFVPAKGNVILGYDGSNLEQFVAASYAWRFDNGDYARSLEGDPHTDNAIAYSKAAGREVTRQAGKNITYGVLYGAQAPKVAKMLGITVAKAQKVIDAFWDTNIGLKRLKKSLEKYWEETGCKYIRGIDGRKIYTRSKHSLINALFQSCGSIIMFYSGNLMADMLKEEGLYHEVKRLIFSHDEYQYEVPRELVKTKKFSCKEEAEEWEDDKLWSNIKEFNGQYYRFYSRIGELGDKSLQMAGKHFDLPMPFRAAYDVGRNLAETH